MIEKISLEEIIELLIKADCEFVAVNAINPTQNRIKILCTPQQPDARPFEGICCIEKPPLDTQILQNVGYKPYDGYPKQMHSIADMENDVRPEKGDSDRYKGGVIPNVVLAGKIFEIHIVPINKHFVHTFRRIPLYIHPEGFEYLEGKSLKEGLSSLEEYINNPDKPGGVRGGYKFTELVEELANMDVHLIEMEGDSLNRSTLSINISTDRLWRGKSMFDSTVMWNNNPRSMKRDIWRVDSVLHNGRRFRLNYSVSMSWPLQRSSDRIGIYCSDNIEDREPKSVEEGIEEFEMKLNNLDTIQTRFSSNI